MDSSEEGRLTVADAVMLYVKNHDLCDSLKSQYVWLVSGATEDQRKAKRKTGYAECIAHKYVDSLTRRDLELVRDCARAGGAGNASINTWTRRLKAAFNYAVAEDVLTKNPWLHYKDLPARHGRRTGTVEDFWRVYACLPPWMQWACRTAFALCLRPGMTELFRLTWKAFDFPHGAVDVYMGKTGRQKTVYPPQDYMAEALERFRAAGMDREAPVCPNSRGGFSRGGYRDALMKARRKAGVKQFSLYAVRHIVASTMLAAGADAAAVAANLGHRSPAVTLRFYAHSSPRAQRQASAELGAAWCGGAGKNE